MLERFFGATITISTGRVVPVRLIGEQHVIEDLGFIPSFADWVRCIRPEPWMGRAQPIHRQVVPLRLPPDHFLTLHPISPASCRDFAFLEIRYGRLFLANGRSTHHSKRRHDTARTVAVDANLRE
jgi:hypothetical protein